ncbi:hypothetical protein SDC9_166817 [bioreactor metagenome]|uniref:DUF4367 domain-containing protein n=1 Tax=bioreactor metagenome TaxID=1076179 RepID=A0A645FY28_9ZZZZ
MVESNQLDDYIIILYENEDGGWISISQQPLENRTFALNNEVDDSGEILIDNEKALWSIKEGLITIFWMRSSTAITISAQNVPFDELVKIAENIIFKK